MEFLVSFLLFIVALIGYCRTKFIFNPISAMSFVWAAILPFTRLGLYGVYDPNEKAFLLIYLGIASYLFGALLGGGNYRFVIGNHKIETKNRKYEFNYLILHILCWISIAFYIIQLGVVLRLLLSGNSYSVIRDLVVNNDNVINSSSLIVQLKGFIAVPTTYLMIAVFPIEILYMKKNLLLMIEAIILMVLFVLTTGGRSVILWIALYFLSTYLFYRYKNPDFKLYISKKYRRLIIIVGILLFLFLLIMTRSLKGSNVDLLKQIFIYFVAPVTHFGHYVEVVDKSGLMGHGISSFYGLLYPFLFLFRLFGFYHSYPPFIQEIYRMSFDIMEWGINIGGGIRMNAFVTAFYQPYLDGRFLGVAIILLFFGIVCSRIFTVALRDNNLKCLLLYNLLLQKIMFSFVRFYFTQTTQALCFIFAIIAIRVTSRESQEIE